MVRSKINKKKEQLKEAVLRPHNSSEEISDIYIRKPSYYDRFVKYFPNLETNLIIAGVAIQPSKYIEKSIITSIINSVFGLIIAFFLIRAKEGSLLVLFPLFFMFLFIFIYLNFFKLKIIIRKKKKAIDNEVVYAGRYMLLKIHSGRPLLNALIDQSQSYGVAADYMKGIVNDVNSGSTIEASLQKAMKYTPSDKLRKVLFYINNALKYGVDVSDSLEWALNEIVEEDILEIRRYGKKMNSLMIFYMLLAVVMPSLGITIFIVITGFLNISINLVRLLVLNVIILGIQLLFLGIIKNIRPTIDL